MTHARFRFRVWQDGAAMRARAPLYVAVVAAPLALSTVITWAVDRNNNTVDLVIREARLDDAEAIGDISGRGWV